MTCSAPRPRTAPSRRGRGGCQSVLLASSCWLPADSERIHDYGAQEEGDEDTCSWSVPGAHKTPTSVWVTVVGDSDDASLQAERDDQVEGLLDHVLSTVRIQD